ASQPVIGRMIALATRYDVSAQVASSMDAESEPAMWGSETFTTVVSSTSMNVANITDTAMSHGLMCRCSDMVSPVAPSPYFEYTVAFTDIPGRRRCSGS